MYHTRYSYPFYIKDVRRVGQLQAAKVSGMSENPPFFKIFQDMPA